MQNNPLSYTDPSGYFAKKVLKKIGSAVKKEGMKVVRRVQGWAKSIGKFFNKNPTLQAVVTAVVSIYCAGTCSNTVVL